MGGAIDATSVRILYRRWSGGYGWAWRRVPERRAMAAVIRVDGPSPVVKISPSISLTTLRFTFPGSPGLATGDSPSGSLLIEIPAGNPVHAITKLDRPHAKSPSRTETVLTAPSESGRPTTARQVFGRISVAPGCSRRRLLRRERSRSCVRRKRHQGLLPAAWLRRPRTQ